MKPWKLKPKYAILETGETKKLIWHLHMWNRRNLSDLGHLKSVTKAAILKHLRNPQTQENLWKPERYKICEAKDILGLILKLQYPKTCESHKLMKLMTSVHVKARNLWNVSLRTFEPETKAVTPKHLWNPQLYETCEIQKAIKAVKFRTFLKL